MNPDCKTQRLWPEQASRKRVHVDFCAIEPQESWSSYSARGTVQALWRPERGAPCPKSCSGIASAAIRIALHWLDPLPFVLTIGERMRAETRGQVPTRTFAAADDSRRSLWRSFSCLPAASDTRTTTCRPTFIRHLTQRLTCQRAACGTWVRPSRFGCPSHPAASRLERCS